MGFWVHSFKERTKREHEAAQRELEHQQRVIARVALAGWRFEHVSWPAVMLVSPTGVICGYNDTIYGAACYALYEMEINVGLPA